MKKSMILIAAAILLLFAFPVAANAAAHPKDVEPAASVAAVAQPAPAPAGDKSTQHYLEWGVFGIAVGEFAGIMGRGLSQVLRDRRAAKAAASAEAPERARPVLMYAERVKESVR